MKLTVLGSSSATPAKDRYPSSQVLSIDEQLYLIDCGEGTQFRMFQYGIKKNKIQAIFISHLHGDHYYGLIGLLSSMSMHERSEKLYIISPKGLKDIIDLQCQYSITTIRFEIEYITFEDDTSTLIYEDKYVQVSTLPLVHKVTTCGFIFDKKYPKYSFDKEKLAHLEIPKEAFITLKEGKDYIDEKGDTYCHKDIVIKNNKSKRFAYCSDTIYYEALIPLLKEVDFLYHEATFLSKDIERAEFTKHSTALQAAQIALNSNVKKLMIGHYSARYESINELLEEAMTVFKDTVLAIEGHTYSI